MSRSRAGEVLRGGQMSEATRLRLRTVTQWLHLSAMAMLVGSTIFVRVGLLPYLDDRPGRPAALGPDVVDRWYSVFPWVGLVVFVATGVFLFLFWLRDSGLSLRASLATPYVRLLVIKVLLANAALGIAVGLGLSRSMADDADAWTAVIVALVVVIVLISATLRRLPVPRQAVASTSDQVTTR